MNLGIVERLMAVQLLPQEGGIIELRVAQEARELLSLTTREIEEWGVSDVEGGGIQWKPGLATTTDIQISSTAVGMITKALKDLDDKKKLTPNHIPLYVKFIEGVDSPTPD